MQQGVVQELHIERSYSRGIVGNIYMGKVVRVLPGMQSAFVEIGLERTAFLHVADIWEERQSNSDTTRPIERILSEGQHIVVQALKDPIGTKGARLSTQVSIAGRLLVYLPREKHIGISQRIEESEREALRTRIQKLLPEGEEGGYIARTMAENATDEELRADIAYLRRLWTEIQNRASLAKPAVS
jgi:ribonuclease G